MRMMLIGCVIGCCALMSGCNLFVSAARNLGFEATLRATDCTELLRERRLARSAWDQQCAANPVMVYSVDYRAGFEDGYIDFLNAGGSGEPPAVPPKRYWTRRYESPAGQQSGWDWFAGFQDGAAAARASGQRQFIIVPVWESAVPVHPDIPVHPDP